MTDRPPLAGPLIDLARLPRGEDTAFSCIPDEARMGRIAADLGLRALRKARLEGRLRPQGQDDWVLEATLGATAVQDCVVTLDPVTTRVDTPVARRYLADFALPPEGETEMPEDDSAEPLPRQVDLAAVLGEALALALPDHPRAEGAELGAQSFTEPGRTPMTDEDVRPFAALKALRGDGPDGSGS